MKATQQKRLAVVHSDSQIAQSLARALRKEQFYTEVVHYSDLTPQLIESMAIEGIITNIHDKFSSAIDSGNSSTPILNVNDFQNSDEEIEQLTGFASNQCNMPKEWTIQAFIDTHIEQIRSQVGDEEVILAISGGVDSSVVAALIHQAIGSQLTCVFVDTGLLRYHEGDAVMQTFADNMGINVIRINAEDRFLSALADVADPEKKRKIIGQLFIDIFEEESEKLSSAKWLAQGTIYPDILESLATKDGKVAVKSHHNVGGLPKEMNLKLIEPLKDLFKHEVREVGVALGLPKEMVYRHPFPGPGLGVRILGAIKKEYADILRLADHIFIEELRKAGYYNKTSQAFAVFIPVKSVGISNGERIYDYVISLRAIETIDFMTARAAHLPYDLIERTSNRIITEVDGVSRVVYDVSNKPPATIEWE